MPRRHGQTQAVAEKRLQKKKRQKQLFYGALAAFVVFIIGAFVYNSIDERGKPGEKLPSEGNTHLDTEPTTYIWDTVPPTSGSHADGMEGWGVKTAQAPSWLVVHSMEDGGVIVNYNCPEGCPELVARMEELMRGIDDDFEQMILQPFTERPMENRIAITAWQRMLTMDELDEEAFVNFIEEYRGLDHHVGPE